MAFLLIKKKTLKTIFLTYNRASLIIFKSLQICLSINSLSMACYDVAIDNEGSTLGCSDAVTKHLS